MRDARTNGARPRTKKTAALGFGKEIKKLSWYEKYILCKSVDDHKEAYQGYCERHEILQQNAEILYNQTNKQGAKPKRTAPTAYKNWNSSRINYLDLEKQLYMPAAAAAPTAESPPMTGNATDESPPRSGNAADEDSDGDGTGYSGDDTESE